MLSLDKCNGSCNAADDLSTKKCVLSKTEGVTVIKRINEVKTSVKQANLAGGPTTLEQKRSFDPDLAQAIVTLFQAIIL